MDVQQVATFFRDTSANIVGNARLREPQLQGYEHTRQHFASSPEHAILQLPVGCGKTGLMALLPFGLAEGRVLIIVPNLEIRRGVARELDYSNPNCFWAKAGVLTDFTEGPHLAVLDGRDANITDCENAHFVLTNIQQLASRADHWLPRFRDDFFDLILVDEGHHNVAASWRRVFDRFPNAKVVSLTATPFRSDGQEVEGRVIYRYPFARAMTAGYIKQLVAHYVAPSEIFFTYLGDEHRHTLDEVIRLREEDWFRRGVALSRETNVSIVDLSIQCLRELRRSGTRHQIIAAACSINHAREIASLYRERGLSAEAVYSDMTDEEREEVLRDLREHRLDAVVQVSILGEGFDHPHLSVAAIFRPFRTLSPYVQFVGRIMRVICQNDPFHQDNEGRVVSHVGLQQDELWHDFQRFDRDDQLLFAELVGGGELPAAGEGDAEGRRPRLRPDMVVVDQVIDRFITEQFLDPNDDAAVDDLIQQFPQLLGVTLEELGLTRQELVARLLSARRRAELRPERIPVQPQAHRQQTRRRLDEQTRSVAGRMLQALRLAPQAPNLLPVFPGLGGNNLGVVIRLMHRQVNEVMGFPRDARADLTVEQNEEAIRRLDELGDQVQAQIEEKLRGRG
jgi:superfamily II DNA or RNA helicase